MTQMTIARLTCVRAYARCIAALAVLAGTTACEPSMRVERRTVGDTIDVHTEMPARIDTATLEVAARYPLKLGGADSTRPRITALALGPDGRPYLASDDGLIHRLDSRGRVEARYRFARADSVSELRGLFVNADGTIVGRDANGDVHAIEAAGERTITSAVAPGPALWSSQWLAPGASGSIRVGLSSAPTSNPTAGNSGLPILASVRADGQISDTVRVPAALLGGCTQPLDTHFRSGAFHDIRTRYIASLQWAPLPSGSVVIGCNEKYQLSIVGTSKHVIRINHDRPVVPVSAEERKSFVAAWTLRMRNASAGPDWGWQGNPLPDRKPAFHRVLTGSDGRIWVWPAQPSERVPAPPQWVLVGGPQWLWVEPTSGVFDVFSANGDFVGSVAVPEQLGFAPFGVATAPVIRGDTLWMITSDSTGSNALVRAHVHWRKANALRDWSNSLLQRATQYGK